MKDNVYTSHHAKKTAGETEMIPRVSDAPVREIRTHQPKKGLSLGAKIMIAIAAFCIGVAGVVGGVAFFGGSASKGAATVSKVTNVVVPDSGVQQCKDIAKNVSSGKTASNDSETTMAEYEAKKKPFQDSRYADIRVAGTNLITLFEQMDKLSKSDDDDAWGAGLVALGQLSSNWTALQTACSNHGVTVPPLPLNS